MVREFDWGRRRDRPPPTERQRVATVPNAVTAVRLGGLPVFVWLVLGPERPLAAFAVLVGIAATDWVDGYLARRLDQLSRLGRLLDPTVDRLVIVACGLTLVGAELLPWPLAALVLARDILVVLGALILFGGIPEVPVTRTGKAATAALLVGLPAFLLAAVSWPGRPAVVAIAWAFTVAGLCGYYASAGQYARATLRLRREQRLQQ